MPSKPPLEMTWVGIGTDVDVGVDVEVGVALEEEDDSVADVLVGLETDEDVVGNGVEDIAEVDIGGVTSAIAVTN